MSSVSISPRCRRPRRPPRVSRALLLCFLLCCSLSRSAALVTPFQHHFELEYPSNPTTTSVNQTASAAPKYSSASGLAALTRWNTYSIVTEFGMERGARLELEVTSLTTTSAAASDVPVVFTLYDDAQWRVYTLLRLRDMPLRSPAVLCHYPSSARFALTPATRGSTTWRRQFDVPHASLYTLQVQVCGDASVDIEGTATLVNVGYDNRLSEHLGVEDLGLIPLYQVLITVYSIMTLLWIAECYRNRRNAPKICYAVQIALHVKTISVTLKLWYYRELSLSGRHEPFLDTAQSLAESGTAAMLLGVALIGSLGWSLTREALSVRERRMIGFVFSVFGAIALAKSLCYSDESDAYRAFMLSEYVVHSILMLTVVVALNFTIAQLRLTLTDARWNSFATPLTYMKLNQFQGFRNLFLLYLLFPTGLLVFNLVVVTPPGLWRYDWVNTLVSEAATLFVYVKLALVLRPLDSYIYSRLSRGTDIRTDRERGRENEPSRVPLRSPIIAAPMSMSPPLDDVASSSGSPAGSVIELNERFLERFPVTTRASATSPASSPRSSPSSSSSISFGEDPSVAGSPSPSPLRSPSPRRQSQQRLVEQTAQASSDDQTSD